MTELHVVGPVVYPTTKSRKLTKIIIFMKNKILTKKN